MAIYLTGDTHGDIDGAKLRAICERITFNENDYVIILGDFGFLWSKKEYKDDLKFLDDLPYTILFIDGNHENFPLLYSFPLIEMFGSKVGKITDKIFHLRRGEIYTIEGKTFLTIGGAHSVDQHMRREGISWWPEEDISRSDIDRALKNLGKYNNCVDYILTHTIDYSALIFPPLSVFRYKHDSSSDLLFEIEKEVSYKKWYFGHFHLDIKLSDKKRCLYHDFVLVE